MAKTKGSGPMQYGGKALPIGRTMGRMLSAVSADEYNKAIKARRAKVDKVDGRIGNRTRFSDEQVAEMRRLHQFGGKTCRQLAEIYQVDRHWMHQILQFELRSRHVYG